MAYSVYQDKVGEIRGVFDNTGNASYSSTWIATFDSPMQDIRFVASLPELPTFFSPCPIDPYAQLTKIDPRQDPNDPGTWNIDLTWSRQSKDQRQFVSNNPLDKPPRVRWTGRDFERPLAYDVQNKGLVCNSAGDPFNPPLMIDDSRPVAIVTTNLQATPDFILDYRNKINSSPFTLDGVYIDTWCARIRSIEVSEWKVEFAQYFREVQYVIELRDNEEISNFSKGVGDPGQNASANGAVVAGVKVLGWQLAVQDAGMRELKYNSTTSAWEKTDMLNSNGLKVSKPELLNGLGGALTGLNTIGNEYYRIFNGYYERDFSVLQLPP